MSVLVTGGSGFLGKRLKIYKPDWIYISSKDYDLTNTEETKQLFRDVSPDTVVHLAGRVGGIKENINNQGAFFYENTMMNTNVLQCAYKSGVERVLSSLSTCAYPDQMEHYPFTEEDFFKGPPVIFAKNFISTANCLKNSTNASMNPNINGMNINATNALNQGIPRSIV